MEITILHIEYLLFIYNVNRTKILLFYGDDMMDYTNKIESLKLKRKTKNLLLEQNNLIINYNLKKFNKYKKDDLVILKRNSLIHGTRADINTLEIISKTGLISSEFYSEINYQKKKPFVVEFWNVQEEGLLSEWLKKYTGVTIDFKNRNGEIYKKTICSIEDIKSNIKKENGFRDYIIYQNQEQRFLPNDNVENDSTLAFIIECDENDNKIIKNDIFDEDFNDKILKDILPNWYYKKYMITRKFDNYETGREKGILLGIPTNMISGIMISRNIEHDKNFILKLKELFPNCYICTLDGVVI
jgi:hypothetical protein